MNLIRRYTGLTEVFLWCNRKDTPLKNKILDIIIRYLARDDKTKKSNFFKIELIVDRKYADIASIEPTTFIPAKSVEDLSGLTDGPI